MSGPVGSSTWFGTPGYDLDQSLRFNQPHDTTLSKTFASAGNRKTWTFSAWVKIGNPAAEGGNQLGIFGTYTNNNDTANIQFDGTGELHFEDYSGSYNVLQVTEAKQRDPSAWYHIMVVFDTTQGTAANRVKLYVNGTQMTTKTGGVHTLPDQNHDGKFNNTAEHKIGMVNGTYCWDGHMAEVHFIDGTALGPESFGTTGVHGEWTPKEFAGAHGTNGFYLPFKNDYTVEGFSAVTYRGNNVAGLYIGGVGFQPDFVWTKKRNGSNSHRLVDAVRGATKTLMSDNSDAQGTENTVTSFETDGFTVGAGNSNNDAGTYVAWNWDMGGSNATLTAGSINSVVRANPTYGQSIVSYTGNAASSATIAHGLSSAPEMIIVRQVGANAWAVYHTSIGATHLLELNTTAAKADNDQFWNDTSPTSSVFTIGGHAEVNPDGVAVIAYAFHSVTGYSKFGSYTGNATSGNTITTGFPVAWVMIKRYDGINNWSIIDNTRTPTGVSGKALLRADESAAEQSGAETEVEFTATGFKINNTQGELNGSGRNYIYAAFADKREYAYWLDQSGNNNDWTSNNLTESDISVDSPTNNFCTWNPLFRRWNVANSNEEGNMKIGFTNSGTEGTGFGTIGNLTSGKWYWETRINAIGSGTRIGISADVLNSGNSPIDFREYLWNVNDGSGSNKSGTFDNTYGADFGTGDIIGVAVDIDNGTMVFYKNNASQGTAFTDVLSGIPDGGWIPMSRGYGTSISTTNWGQDSSFAGSKVAQGNTDGNGIGDFYYAPPSGFLALCTNNLPEPIVASNHFNTVLYTGNGVDDRSITGVGFQPDMVWWKERSSTSAHYISDVVRGATKQIIPNGANTENNNTDELQAFESDGFQIGTQASINQDTITMVAWNWKAGNANTAFSESGNNPAGTHRANVAAGFSIVSYVGTGAAGTVAHGLSVAPELMLIKNRDVTDDWAVYYGDNTDYMVLNTTAATADAATYWNDTSPTASVFTVNTAHSVNADGENYIAYVFHSVDGFSKIGTYYGNGADDGAFAHTGFKPAFIMVKEIGGANQWHMMDNKRSPINQVDDHLKAQDNAAEDTDNAEFVLDFLSNGFKWRDADHDNQTGSYWYMAFAERPFKYANAK